FRTRRIATRRSYSSSSTSSFARSKPRATSSSTWKICRTRSCMSCTTSSSRCAERRSARSRPDAGMSRRAFPARDVGDCPRHVRPPRLRRPAGRAGSHPLFRFSERTHMKGLASRRRRQSGISTGVSGPPSQKNLLPPTSRPRFPGLIAPSVIGSFDPVRTTPGAGRGSEPVRRSRSTPDRRIPKMQATRMSVAILIASAFASGLAAQQPANADSTKPAAASPDSVAKKPAPTAVSLYRPFEINHIRPADQRGINVYESPKEEQVPFTGFALSFGGAFTQEFQGLQHQNSATAVVPTGSTVNSNQLMTIGHGFNNAVANLNVNAQIAPGMRIAMTSYLSARHHQESWVKDGYFLIDNSPIDNPLLNSIMKYTTLKVGHFEINYGDSHFRRSDNGNSIYNPFVGNYILDAFTTEIGAEVYARSNGLIAM